MDGGYFSSIQSCGVSKRDGSTHFVGLPVGSGSGLDGLMIWADIVNRED